jgi:hypothetical protein
VKRAKPEPPLPIDPERLRKSFPDLTDADVAAYVAITRRVLGSDQKQRAQTLHGLMQNGRAAQERAASGGSLSEDEALLVRYLGAVQKMQPKRSAEGLD